MLKNEDKYGNPVVGHGICDNCSARGEIEWHADGWVCEACWDAVRQAMAIRRALEYKANVEQITAQFLRKHAGLLEKLGDE